MCIEMRRRSNWPPSPLTCGRKMPILIHMDGMLARYRRPGGFLQLLSLLESFGPQKREKFMRMIEDEDKDWSRALATKLLTMERLYTWPEEIISEIIRRLPVKNLACIVKSATPVNEEKIVKFMSHAERRKLDDELGSIDPKPDEVFAAHVKLVEITRKMIKEGEIRVDKFDPTLLIPEGYEGKIHLEASGEPVETVADEPTIKMTHRQLEKAVAAKGKANSRAESGDGNQVDIMSLQRTIASLSKENKALKEELIAMRVRLEQIKKIA